MSDTPSSSAAQEEASSAEQEQTQKQSLPVSIHPDDAKDKVFAAILKALSKMGNKPSSPKELANVIIKYKYATLGGATPFATVSSRISQHFKRAAEHNPPRAPLLARHFDQNHSRKINYSLATDSVSPGIPQQLPSSPPHSSHVTSPPTTAAAAPSPSPSPSPASLPPGESSSHQTRQATRRRLQQQNTFDMSDASTLSSEGNQSPTASTKRQASHAASQTRQTQHFTRSTRQTATPNASASTGQSATASTMVPRRRMRSQQRLQDGDNNQISTEIDAQLAKDEDADDESEGESSRRASKRTRHHRLFHPHARTTRPPSPSPITASSSSSLSSLPYSPPSSIPNLKQKESNYTFPPADALATAELSDNESEADYSDYHEEMMKGDEAMADIELNSANRERRRSSVCILSRRPSVVVAADMQRSVSVQTATPETSSPHLNQRRQSLSFHYQPPNLFGGDEFWPSYNSLDQEFDPVFLTDDVAGQRVPLNIAAPESVSVAELETYFSNGDTTASTNTDGLTDIPPPLMSSSARTSRKSFSALAGSKETSLLQKALLASTARGMMRQVAASPEAGGTALDTDAETPETPPLPRRKSWPEDGVSSGALLDPDDKPEDKVETLPVQEAAQSPESPETLQPTMKKATDFRPLDRDKGKDEEKGEEKEKKKDVLHHNDKKSTTTYSAMGDTVESDDAEVFVQFEDDDDRKTTFPISDASNTNPSTTPAANPLTSQKLDPKDTVEGTSVNGQAVADVLKSMNINLSTFQQMAATLPGLSNLPSTFDLSKTLTAYMQTLAKASPSPLLSGGLPIPTSGNGPAANGSPPLTPDIQAVLARFPALEALLRKDVSSASPNAAAAAAANVNVDPQHQEVVYTIMPTTPPMYITVVDNIAVCVAVLAPTDTVPECRIMRRLDSGYINGTMLLTAGGIDTESERSMILSFEMERIRMPKKMSQLCGTWIPLHRAQELAVTCSIQHRLGAFLSDNVESYFPSPLPISVPVTRRPLKDGRLTAIALAALRNTGKSTHAIPPPISRPVSPPARTTSTAQLHQLISNSQRGKWGDYALKAPLLGSFDDSDEDRQRPITVIDNRSAASRRTTKGVTLKRQSTDDGSDVDIVNDASDDEEEEDTDTDTDVEEVRQRMKKMRDAAIDAMERGSSLDLDELLRRAGNPIVESPKRQLSMAPYARFHRHGHSTRRRPTGSGKTSGGKIAPAALKKSASWSGSLTSPLKIVLPSKKMQGQLHPSRKSGHPLSTRSKSRGSSSDGSTQDPTANRVVEHTIAPSTSTVSTTKQVLQHTMPSSPSAISTISTDVLATIQEDDEDEEIDIGGSDGDDDLR